MTTDATSRTTVATGITAAVTTGTTAAPRLTVAALRLAAALLAAALFASACGAGASSSPKPIDGNVGSSVSGAAPPKGTIVDVLYAGSLTNLMENDLGPAFGRATGYRFRGEGKGSTALAHEIRGKLRRGDVFISAASSVDDALMGSDNGDWVRWYATFAEAPVVVAYNPKSRFAAAFARTPWYEVLQEGAIRIGRTDPRLDPKGRRTLDLVAAAGRKQGRDLTSAILGSAENPAQIFPEQTLVGRLQAGQLDAGFLYKNEAVEQHLPYIQPDAAIDPKAVYTVTILNHALHPRAAAAFVRFLLGPEGRARLQAHGLMVVAPQLSGDAAAVPDALRHVVTP